MSDPSVRPPPPHTVTCPRCGAAFQCGAGGEEGECWCMDESYRLPMPPSAVEECLCPNCLRAEADQYGDQVLPWQIPPRR